MELWGWGRKNTADVTDEGELKTRAATMHESHKTAVAGNAYTMDIDGITIGADGNTLAMLKNSHDARVMIVTHFNLSTFTGKEDQEIEVYIGGAFIYLANGTAVVPTNTRSGKSGGAPGGVSDSFYVTDGSASTLTTVTAGSVAGRYPMITKGVVYECRKQSGWIVDPGNCFYLTAAKDEKFKGFISFYYEEPHG